MGVAADTFNRADANIVGSTASDGGTWAAALNDGAGIVTSTNRLRAAGASVAGGYGLLRLSTALAGVDVTATWSVVNRGGGGYLGIAVRVADAAATGYYALIDNGHVYLGRLIAGTATDVVTGVFDFLSGFPIACSWAVTGSGASVHHSFSAGGSEIATWDDSNPARIVTGSKVGIFYYGDASAADNIFDSLSVDDGVGGGTPSAQSRLLLGVG